MDSKYCYQSAGNIVIGDLKIITGSRILVSSAYRLHQQGRRRRSGRTASAGPLFGPSMLSAESFFLVSAHFTFYFDFIHSAKIY